MTVEPGLLLETADFLLLSTDETLPLRRANVSISQPRAILLLESESGKEREKEEEWRERESRGMESKGICNANGCPATLNNSKC